MKGFDNRPPTTIDHQQEQRNETKEETQKDQSKLTKVKRLLSGSFIGRGCTTTADNTIRNCPFGLEIESSENYEDTGVPFIVHRLCSFIEERGFNDENVFRSYKAASPKLVERLRKSFEQQGDADLETAGCMPTVIVLLRQYLKELPRPVVGPKCVNKLMQLHSKERDNNRESWIKKTRELLLSELPTAHYQFLSYLIIFFGRYELKHKKNSTGITESFAPILLPHLPAATQLFKDMLIDAKNIFSDCQSFKDSSLNGITTVLNSDCKDLKDDIKFSILNNPGFIKTSKRKDRRDSDVQERKLIRSSSEEKIWDNSKRLASANSNIDSIDTIRRVSSHEDFKTVKSKTVHLNLQNEMGHGIRYSNYSNHDRTNISPVSSKSSLIQSPTSDVILANEKYDCDAEYIRNNERFSRSLVPRERRPARNFIRKIYKTKIYDNNLSDKDNEAEETSDSSSQSQSFMEMFNSGPSRSPSPARSQNFQQDDYTSQTLTDWGYQARQTTDEEMPSDVEAMISPRNSLLMPRRFYLEDDVDDQINAANVQQYGLKSLMKQINNLKKKIRKYESEFEDNFGYRPSHSDKMSNRDVKRICSELHKVRKEHKILKEGFINTFYGNTKLITDENSSNCNNNNNNNDDDKARITAMTETVKDIEKKLNEKKLRTNRSDDLDELSYEQLLDEKTCVQKALLQIENTFGRPVSKEDRLIVRPLYDKYRILKKLLIRAGANKNKDSMSELATILEHEAMDFTSNSGLIPVDCDRRASEPDMSHRGILDCLDTMEQVQTDSDSQHSSSEGSRGLLESLHALPRDELLQQQRIAKEEKKRLRRALKELEIQFEVRVGRRMQREDRGPRVSVIYDSYKQTKARLRLISALVAKNNA